MNFPVQYDLQYGAGSVCGPEEEAAVLEVLRAGAPGYGPASRAFEKAFSEFIGVDHALAVSSGSAALHLAMMALGLAPGDEVITTPLSWMSTANGAALAGAKVVFADIDPRTFTLDPAAVEAKITDRTKAIVPVHLYGQPAAIDEITTIARRHGCALIEDCAHAPGALYKGRKVGSFGDLAIFSFGTQKNMTTLGEGGMVVTNRADLAERVRSYRWICAHGPETDGRFCHWEAPNYWNLEFPDVGFNYRMTDVQAAVGLVQLRKIDGLNHRRRQIAAGYTHGLAGMAGLTLPFVAVDCYHVFHVYCVLVETELGVSKEEFMMRLWRDKGVKPWSHYHLIHLTEAYRRRGHRAGECPVAESLQSKYVSLPIHPRLTDEAVEYLIQSVRAMVPVAA